MDGTSSPSHKASQLKNHPILKMEAPEPWARQPGRKSKAVFWNEQLSNTANRRQMSNPLPPTATAPSSNAALTNTKRVSSNTGMLDPDGEQHAVTRQLSAPSAESESSAKAGYKNFAAVVAVNGRTGIAALQRKFPLS
jgi:hypothetical protein